MVRVEGITTGDEKLEREKGGCAPDLWHALLLTAYPPHLISGTPSCSLPNSRSSTVEMSLVSSSRTNRKWRTAMTTYATNSTISM